MSLSPTEDGPSASAAAPTLATMSSTSSPAAVTTSTTTSTPISTPTSTPTTTPAATPSPPQSATAAAPVSTNGENASTAGRLYQSYHSQIDNLKRLPVPYSDIYHALSSHDTIPLSTLIERFRGATSTLTTWLETAEMAVFALDMDVRQEGATDKRDVGEMDVIMNRFQPNIDMLVELKERIESRLKTERDASLDDEPTFASSDQELQQTTQSIKASWASLKQMLDKAKGELAGARVRGELMTHMDNVLIDIDDICASIDAYNLERSAITSDEEGFLPSRSNSNQQDAQAKQRSLDTLSQVDSRIELLIPRIDFLDNRVGSLPTDESSPGSDALQNRYQQVLLRWDDLKFRRERVSEELKEDKWLEVFDQVAEQVESMMESMERAVIHCQGLLDQIRAMVRQKIVPDAPIDREHLYSIFKSFEAKHKYYAPAVNKMLDMLENGIESRTTRNMDVISRHQAMNLKWDQLEDALERVDMELDNVEVMLDVLDDSRTPYLPKLPLKEPPKKAAPAAAKRPQSQNSWKSPAQLRQQQQPRQQQQQQQQQQQANQMQRGRRPVSAAANPTQDPRSYLNAPNNNINNRPWSPANSSSGLSQSGLLTAAALNGYRSLSPSPTRSPTGYGRSRPWCPSVSLSSPGIPGIPCEPTLVSTYLQRPASSAEQRVPGAPTPIPTPVARAGSAMAGSARNAATPGSQYRPKFSPVGSNSKLSSGIHSTLSTPAPSPGARKTQLPLPSPRNAASPAAHRAAASPSPQLQRPGSRTYGAREAASPGPSSNYGVFSPPSSRLPTSAVNARARQTSTNGGGNFGYGVHEGRSSPASSHANSRQNYHGPYEDRPPSNYGSRPSSAAGSVTSMGRDSYAYTSYDEPTSPSASSASSITSASFRQQSSTSRYQFPAPKSGQRSHDLPEMMDRLHMRDVPPMYEPERGDELDEEFSKVVNASPIQIQVRKLGSGKYYFGGRVDEHHGSLIGGKLALCRLMEYSRNGGGEEDSGVSSGSTDDGHHSTGGRPKSRAAGAAVDAQKSTKKRRVMVRVGGGWQDLDIFMLDHSALATDLRL